MYTLVVDFMNFQAAVSESRNPKRVPLAPTSDKIQSDSRVERATPLCENEWRSFFNDDGRILNESALRKAIFKGTLDPCCFSTLRLLRVHDQNIAKFLGYFKSRNVTLLHQKCLRNSHSVMLMTMTMNMVMLLGYFVV